MTKLSFNVSKSANSVSIVEQTPIQKVMASVRTMHGDERSQESKRSMYLGWLLRAATGVAVVGLAFTWSAAAHAESNHIWRDSVFTSNFNGATISTRCHHSFYTGTTCDTNTSGDILRASQPSQPAIVDDTIPPANWAAKCGSSCVDVSNDKH